ncbi:MAG: cell division protein FtsA [Holosporaceae bacterium]|nr:cell division protein FtsA [Holosporaceae bacterium]
MSSGTIAVLDIGSSKVCCCVADVSDDGRFRIIGVGYCVCFGVKAGVIIDMRSVEKSISKAVEDAEKAANFRIKSVYVNVSGKDVKSKIVNASLNVGGRIVGDEDVLSLFNYCVQEDGDETVIHSIPIRYNVDSLQGIRNPVGMVANALSVSMNLVSVPKAQLDNLMLCLAKCHLEPAGVVASIYASGLCAMDDGATNQIVIDFGGGTASIGFFYDGIFSGMSVVPLGGKNVADDVAYVLNIPSVSAEKLKNLHGSAFVSICDEREPIFIPVAEDDDVINLQKIAKSSLNQIIQPRVEEILKMIKKKIDESPFGDKFSRNVVMTGGGSMLTGMRDFAADILNKRVKIKRIENLAKDSNEPLNNSFSVAIGMIKFAKIDENRSTKVKKSSSSNKNGGFFRKALIWIENNL